jgi:hypothetical protein
MRKFLFYLNALTPLVIILYFRFTGTTLAEYNENFRLVRGEIEGPFIELNESYELIVNDSLATGTYEYEKFTSELLDHELLNDFKKIKGYINHLLTEKYSIVSNDSIGILSRAEWDSLKNYAEVPVATIDTSLSANLHYEVTFPLRFSYERRLSGSVYFSLKGHEDIFRIADLEKRIEWLEDDPYKLKERISLSGMSFNTFSEYDEFIRFKNYLNKVLGDHNKISVLRLNSKSKYAKAYKLFDENNNLIYEDELAIEGLEYAKNPLGLIDVFAEEGDSRFILWYDNWYIKLLIFVQILYFLVLIGDIRSSIKS